MGFHWVTFLAQILNLFVLVWLLKRFLYRPIIDVIAKRQAYIEDKVKNAEKAALAAQKQQDTLTKQAEQWQADRQKRLDAVYREAEALKQEQTEQIRQEATHLRQKMQDDLNREALAKELEIRNIMIQNFMDLSRQILTDFSGIGPMAQGIELFKQKVKSLPKSTLNTIKTNLKKEGSVTVTASEKLTPAEQQNLTAFLTETLGNTTLKFAVQNDLILGLEVTIGETVLEWNLKSYLDLFENNLNTALAGLIVKE